MKEQFKSLEAPDSIHLMAADGWLGLGLHLEANEELDQIAPMLRAHPAVLSVRYQIYAKMGQWDGAAQIAETLTELTADEPAAWIWLAYASRRKSDGGIPAAKRILTQARIQFPSDYLIAYNLACYECQLGDLKASIRQLGEAIDLAGNINVRLMALEDPDLEPLWNHISEI